ncbi:nucleoside deaminase [Nocardia flavorosea]|uniref:nucleoside deaminase n=1 Tax=Nocardia flavorosea TaxID=53429 RepID=UPI001894CCBB|nr:nucleoside deaminase [Nocardia flavorosea]MBF6352155.1 nucleoside deaminase [Nocardia flavorosea]
MTVSAQDLTYLRRCIELAREALAVGDEPFGSVLVAADGTVLFEDRNRVNSGDATRHPEFAISRWAAGQLPPEQRAAATVYTSGEHCPMCSASHGWAGLGRIVYITSGSQFRAWLREWDVPAAPVASLPIGEIVPGVVTDGPVDELAGEVRELYRACFAPSGSTS